MPGCVALATTHYNLFHKKDVVKQIVVVLWELLDLLHMPDMFFSEVTLSGEITSKISPGKS